MINEIDNLLSPIRNLIENMKTETPIEELDLKLKQLKAINNTIQQLESKNVPVPSDFRGMKITLLSEVDRLERSSIVLAELRRRLLDIIKDIDSTIPKTSKPRERERERAIIQNQTPQSFYKPLIVDCLKNKGGSAHVSEVIEWIKQFMQGKFLSGDFEQRSGGNIVWEHNVHWARQHLVNDGVLKNDSPRGYRQLS